LRRKEFLPGQILELWKAVKGRFARYLSARYLSAHPPVSQIAEMPLPEALLSYLLWLKCPLLWWSLRWLILVLAGEGLLPGTSARIDQQENWHNWLTAGAGTAAEQRKQWNACGATREILRESTSTLAYLCKAVFTRIRDRR
jgi:hypothetical protein